MKRVIFHVVLLFSGGWCAYAQSPEWLLTDPERFRSGQADVAVDADASSSVDVIDVNYATLDALQDHPLIGVHRGIALFAHRMRFGPLLGIEELVVVDGFDTASIRNLKQCIRFGSPFPGERFRIQQLLVQSEHELLVRQRRSLEHQPGFGDGNYPFYTGDPNYLMMRYRIRAGRHFSLGILAEKDAGEQLFARSAGGRMDFFSWSVMLRPDRFIRSLCIGDFQLQFGQGLVLWSGVSLGKGNEVTGISRKGAGVRMYNSPGESGFQRGVAISLGHRSWTFDTWFSFRKLDASFVVLDTSRSLFAVSSILESGLHRSADERSRKSNLGSMSTGFHLMREQTRLVQELTFNTVRFSHPLWPGDDPYERFDAGGRSTSALAYTLRFPLPNGQAFAEAAVDAQGDPAWLSGLVFMPDRRWILAAHLREFHRAYHSLGGDAFREGTQTRNERGLYFGMRWQVLRVLALQAWYDRFTFPWLRYTQSAPVSGNEWQAHLHYTPGRTTEVQLRYRYEQKPTDMSGDVFRLPVSSDRRSMRLDLSWMQGKDWGFQSRVEWNRMQQSGQSSTGLLLFHEFRYKPMGKPFSVVMRYTVFRTDSYASRVYTYEQDMAGVFSLPAYSGQGQHAYILCRFRLRKGLDLWLRCGRTRTNVGPQTELKSQVRFQF